MTECYVLDASALLALLNAEPGAETVAAKLHDSVISAVNVSEVIAKLVDHGGSPENIDAALLALQVSVIDFNADHAREAGFLRRTMRGAGLSLGDRACLALAHQRGATALTADRSWAEIEGLAPVELLR